MISLVFFVPGRPLGKERSRFGRGRSYTAPQTAAAESAFRWYAVRALPAGFVPFDAPVRLELEFRFDRPRRSVAHVTSKDIDNLAKLAQDALNPPRPTDPDQRWPGAWTDDSRVVELLARKCWADAGHPEGTYVTIGEIACA